MEIVRSGVPAPITALSADELDFLHKEQATERSPHREVLDRFTRLARAMDERAEYDFSMAAELGGGELASWYEGHADAAVTWADVVRALIP